MIDNGLYVRLEDSNSQSLLLICLDGHGEVGHRISQVIIYIYIYLQICIKNEYFHNLYEELIGRF
jgi:serine/threonine protein phosphatase PrpC